MDIMGSVNISLDMPDAAILHNFRVLNSKTYRNVLLGRDFLAKFDRIEFDFAKNRVRIGKHWFPCRDVRGKETREFTHSYDTATANLKRSSPIVLHSTLWRFPAISRALTPVWWPRAATSILIHFSQKIKIKFNLKTTLF